MQALMGIDRLAEEPDRQVILHASAADADAGVRLIPSCIHVAFDGDPREADLSPVACRSVVVAPLADQSLAAGLAQILLEIGAAKVTIIDPVEPGWTLASAEAMGWGSERTIAEMKTRKVVVSRDQHLGRSAGAEAELSPARLDPTDMSPDERAAFEADGTEGERSPSPLPAPAATAAARREVAARIFDPIETDSGTPAPDIGPRPVLDPENPRPSAREFLSDRHRHGKQITLRYHGGLFYAWNGRCYPETDGAVLESHVWAFLERALCVGKREICEPFKPNRSKVGEVLAAVKSETVLHRDVQAPAWLNNEPDNPPAAEIMPCANGLLHLPSKLLYDATPDLWCHNAVDFPYEPEALAPVEWLRFLAQLWPDDTESISTIQEIFGYLLTTDTSMQKIFMLIGPGRSGKGTIGRVLTAMIGRRNIASPTLASICTNFGLQPLIGKSLALIGDARIGNRSDQAQIAERLLSISGEDSIDIDRKFLPAWTGRLSSRIVILTNEIPKLADASGTLGSRFIILRLTRSFYGKEDTDLTDRLIAELPGILNWAIAGWVRLHDRRRFVQPRSSSDILAQLQALGSPVLAFVRECCTVSSGNKIGAHDLFAAWCRWCEKQGKRENGTLAWFSRDLLAVVAGIEAKEERDESRRRRPIYLGIALTDRDEQDDTPI